MSILLGKEIRKVRILFIEDDEVIQQTVKQALEAEDFEIHSVYDGQAALELLTSFEQRQHPLPFDLILLDLILPRVSGWDLCTFVRCYWCIPILMLSACNSEDDKVLGLEMGADDYLSKPFGVKELVARCRKLLRQPFNQVSRSSVLQFRDIHLHLDEAKVVVRGEEVILPFKEFSLLRILMERPYRVWAREELITLIWGPDFDGNPKTLDVHICQLRKKLERNPDRPEYIVTVRGIGYRFGSSG